MDILLSILKAFLVGGIICSICQIFIDKTKVTPARILVCLVVLGVVLTAVGIYKPILDFAGTGASVPLLGFGSLLATGVKEGVDQHGLLGALSGGLTASAAGIAATVFFSFIAALICRSKDKS